MSSQNVYDHFEFRAVTSLYVFNLVACRSVILRRAYDTLELRGVILPCVFTGWSQ